MIRPWKVAVAVVLGVAALPCSAMAQTAPDTTPPTVTITSPENGTTYKIGQQVAASYSCIDPGGSGAPTCVGTAAQGAMIDTAAAGPHTFTVNSTDQAGNSNSASATYNVVESDDGSVGGQTPPTLTLTLGPAGAFAPFIPGVARSYTTTATARVITSSLDATLSVADPSAVQTGHLVNGSYSLSQPLEIAATKDSAQLPTATTPVGTSSSPTMLLTYAGPANETDTVLFKQPILETDALRTGAYAKTLTFTLSTTNP
jgi:hypothetical protein